MNFKRLSIVAKRFQMP
jgi:hypothetical protein